MPDRQAGSTGSSPILRYPAASYFALTFLLSWSAALLVAAPHVWRHEALPELTGILMFPAMLVGPSVSGVVLTWQADGANALRELFARMNPLRIPARWWAILLLPPTLILAVLLCLSLWASSVYSPNFFFIGLVFGVPAGLLEEIGWTGFAFPKLCQSLSPLTASLSLGLLWSLWHLPVINFLGTATPHGAYWFPYFCVFAAAMIAMRVLISWAFTNTGSVLLAQLMHISSTGSLVIFSPPRATAQQEVLWYGVYAAALWLAAGIVVALSGTGLRKRETC